MSECTGLFGYIFGHSYKSFKIKSKIPEFDWEFRGDPKELEEILKLKQDTFEIRCRRCGEKHE